MSNSNHSKAFKKILALVESTGDCSYFFNTYARLSYSYKIARTHLARTRISRLLIEMNDYAPI